MKKQFHQHLKKVSVGTGFFIDNQGHIITNNHVVAPCNGKQKVFYKNKEIKAKLIAKDEQLDLALLKIDVKNKNYIKISNKPIKNFNPSLRLAILVVKL